MQVLQQRQETQNPESQKWTEIGPKLVDCFIDYKTHEERNLSSAKYLTYIYQLRPSSHKLTHSLIHHKPTKQYMQPLYSFLRSITIVPYLQYNCPNLFVIPQNLFVSLQNLIPSMPSPSKPNSFPVLHISFMQYFDCYSSLDPHLTQLWHLQPSCIYYPTQSSASIRIEASYSSRHYFCWYCHYLVQILITQWLYLNHIH